MGTAIEYRETPYPYEHGLPPVLSGDQACKLLGYRKSRFYKLVALGVIPDDLRAPLPRGWSRDKVLNWLMSAPPPVRKRAGVPPPRRSRQTPGRTKKTGATPAAKQ